MQTINGQKQELRFFPNMRILADEFEEALITIELYHNFMDYGLHDIRYYTPGGILDARYVYLMEAEDLRRHRHELNGYACIARGGMMPEDIPPDSTVIVILQKVDMFRVLTLMQQCFTKYRDWDWRVHKALLDDQSLDQILLASMEIFRNPMFIHDNNFNILSDPAHVPEMSVWETDQRTGKQIVSMSLINDFRTDYEYLDGLKNKKPVLFSQNQTGYQILYRNLWHQGHYTGRILVDAVRSPIKPGNFYTLDYLGQLLESGIKSEQLVWLSIESDLGRFFSRCMETKTVDEAAAGKYLQALDWKWNDNYVVMKIVTTQKGFTVISSYATIGQIELQLPESKAFFHDSGVYVVMNLTQGEKSVAEAVWRLSVLIREGLLKLGISSVIHDFRQFLLACRQADIALDHGLASDSMMWYYYFDNYKLDYMIRCAAKEMPLHMLTSDALPRLLNYDQENGTELYRTLKIYLMREQNVLQTAKELFIHRSTLAYRLKKIQKLINADFDNPEERLKLLISFYMDSGLKCPEQK